MSRRRQAMVHSNAFRTHLQETPGVELRMLTIVIQEIKTGQREDFFAPKLEVS
jgi:hypothetical protein